jgi:hypothetical protein
MHLGGGASLLGVRHSGERPRGWLFLAVVLCWHAVLSGALYDESAFEAKVCILYPIAQSSVAPHQPLHIVVLSDDFDVERDDNRIFLSVDGAALRPVEAGLFMDVIGGFSDEGLQHLLEIVSIDEHSSSRILHQVHISTASSRQAQAAAPNFFGLPASQSFWETERSSKRWMWAGDGGAAIVPGGDAAWCREGVCAGGPSWQQMIEEGPEILLLFPPGMAGDVAARHLFWPHATKLVVCARRQPPEGVSIVTAVDGAKHSFVATYSQPCTTIPLPGLANGHHMVHVALTSASKEPLDPGGAGGEGVAGRRRVQGGRGGEREGSRGGGAGGWETGSVYETLLTPWAEGRFEVSNDPALHAFLKYRAGGVQVAGFMHVATLGAWQGIVKEIQQHLRSNEALVELTEHIHVTAAGNATDELRGMLLSDSHFGSKVSFSHPVPVDLSLQELPALKGIWEFCQTHPEHLIWCVHSRVVTHITHAHARAHTPTHPHIHPHTRYVHSKGVTHTMPQMMRRTGDF